MVQLALWELCCSTGRSDAFDFSRFLKARQGKKVDIPIYCTSPSLLNARAAFQASGGKKSTAKTSKAAAKPPAARADGVSADMSMNNAAGNTEASSAAAAENAAAAAGLKGKKGRSKGDSLYYRVKCKDNGVGMPHDKVRHI